jgi:hypothetical protein
MISPAGDRFADSRFKSVLFAGLCDRTATMDVAEEHKLQFLSANKGDSVYYRTDGYVLVLSCNYMLIVSTNTGLREVIKNQLHPRIQILF